MRDRYLDVVYQHQSLIVMLYQRYADRKPVMLFDIQEQRIYAHAYTEFRGELSERSQAMLKEQYERAIAIGEMVVFVRAAIMGGQCAALHTLRSGIAHCARAERP